MFLTVHVIVCHFSLLQNILVKCICLSSDWILMIMVHNSSIKIEKKKIEKQASVCLTNVHKEAVHTWKKYSPSLPVSTAVCHILESPYTTCIVQ